MVAPIIFSFLFCNLDWAWLLNVPGFDVLTMKLVA